MTDQTSPAPRRILRISRKTLLAIEAVLDVAIHARPEPVQAKEITRRQGVPQRYLEQLMQHLVHAGVLKGVRGPRGGYTLAKERRKILVGEIVRVVDAFERGEDGAQSDGSDLASAAVRPLWGEAQAAMMEVLDRVSVEDLCARADQAGELRRPTTADFTI